MKRRINLTVCPETHDKAKKLAESKGISFSSMIELMLRDALKQDRRRVTILMMLISEKQQRIASNEYYKT